jgi:hypothetical protein
VNTTNPALQNTDKNEIISIIHIQFPMSEAEVGIGLYMKCINFSLST